MLDKYELGSTGEYTQGAGAIATLVKANPRLLAIDADWGVGTRAVYDFYKPLRPIHKGDLISEVLHLANRNSVDVVKLAQDLQKGIDVSGILDSNEFYLNLHKDTPVFDGPYSNRCYQDRIKEALAHYRRLTNSSEQDQLATSWDRLIFHLPYAFQARRMFGEIFWQEMQNSPQQAELAEQIGLDLPEAIDFEDEVTYQKALTGFWRAVTKTPLYRNFAAERIAPAEKVSGLVGNMYAGSIFLALMGSLEHAQQTSTLDEGSVLGFFAYGSGSKSKVFRAELQGDWQSVVAGFGLMDHLEQRMEIDYHTYELLHRKACKEPVQPAHDYFYQTEMDEKGTRKYHIPKIAVAVEA